jgi:hypothetical protein
MYSKSQFHALELMCRERAVVAAKEMEYWLAEAEEWARVRSRYGDELTIAPELAHVQVVAGARQRADPH